MKLSLFIGRLLALILFVLISYCITASIAVKSTLGIIFGIISLGATIVFLYLLPKLYQERNKEETKAG